ncbi:UDP-N-acetylmuramoyl-L-alanine--D-glutamate ligase [Marinicauda salina]|uniref:UDP-N-acetylmuramoylalanine--D-glutamate ligase n=1 Tax=Marinicauda salina TaxID=2135793 RepID=A0A2U2BUR3_9PROT|nr:UDP-N-acetylmuramoyl-L-alanine--D-glutamate ligase [Marinicauda salina]PWE17720.1 UDP-N-acetylmuramoyl-L-alanine--D-glutamate ligase [Marinicauda salina]
MIPVRAYEGRRVAVFGLGRTGISAALALAAGGAEVSAWDDREEARAAAEARGVTLDDLNRRDWGDLAALVLSPGVPLTHPKPHRMVELARAVGAPIIGDVELFAQAVAPVDGVRVIGVTGTNGKSTTTALIGHMLKEAGLDVRVGGNIGEAALDLDPPRPGAIYVLELSSYQLDLVESLRCNAALFLNLTPDHLDRHGDLAGYVAAKKRIFANQTAEDAAIVGVDDSITRRICTELRAGRDRTVIPISAAQVLGEGAYAVGGTLYDALDGRATEVADLNAVPALPGRHNAQNAAAAYAAVRRMGVDAHDAARGLASFPGLAHRQERVGTAGPVSFVNDSKATNAEAAAQALGCYEDVFWIAGGQAKEGGVKPLKPFLPRIRKAYLIGEDADLLKRQLKRDVEVVMCGDLETATARAARDAADSGLSAPVVLLSPACASFDQFRDFEHRGDVFRELVNKLLRKAKEGDAA